MLANDASVSFCHAALPPGIPSLRFQCCLVHYRLTVRIATGSHDATHMTSHAQVSFYFWHFRIPSLNGQRLASSEAAFWQIRLPDGLWIGLWDRLQRATVSSATGEAPSVLYGCSGRVAQVVAQVVARLLQQASPSSSQAACVNKASSFRL